mmetsp:Transcript_48705/g.115766  ORF Transcript_48705/g.115766 Transcript_48705/m.115766 type:complete len:1036 (+) Transcript_48705:39-3146(+)
MPAKRGAAVAPLPIDEKCLHGTLGNGMEYYIQNNKKPEARAELRLVVKVGSVFETEQEQGVAHIVEHLAFRGTAMYTNFEVVRFLESIGAKFGACQNAYTAFDETVYFVHLPIDTEGTLEKSLTILREWGMFIRCSDEDVEAERGIVMEEWRQGRTATGRSDEDYVTTLMQGSLYADRLPIGKVDVIEQCTPETVRGFYKRWYHPRRMAVIAVGDFEAYADGPQTVLKLIRRILDIPSPNPWTPRPETPFPEHSAPLLSVFRDLEATTSSVCVDCKRPRQPVETAADYRRTILEHLFHEGLEARLYKMAVSPQAPFFSASTSLSFPTSIMETCALAISAEEGQELRALEVVMTEVERVKQHGFHEDEMLRAKANLVSDLEADHLERDQLQSEGFCANFLEHFCRGEPAMGVEYEVQLCRDILPGIRAEEVAKVADSFDWSANCVVKITRPKASWMSKVYGAFRSMPGISVLQIQEAMLRVHAQGALEPLEQSETRTFRDMLTPAPPRGSIVRKKVFSDAGVTEVLLSNGLRVCYKKTDFLDDEVQFKAYALGGLSELSNEALNSGRMCTAIASEVGAFGIPPADLVDMMAGMRVSLNTEVSTYSRAVAGECSPSDLEAALQMVHLLFTCQLRPDRDSLAVLLRMLREQVENQWRDPHARFANKISELNSGGSSFFKPLTASDIDAIDTHLACAFFRRCFRDPSDFTLVLSGNLDESALLPLLEQYVASIPRPMPSPPSSVAAAAASPLATSTPSQPLLPTSRENLTPVEVAFPEERVEAQLYENMVDPLCCTQLTFPVRIEPGPLEVKETLMVGHVVQLLETRLVERMRFEQGAIYNVSCQADFSSSYPSLSAPLRGTAAVSFTCRPSDIKKLTGIVLTELEQLKAVGPTPREVATRVEIARREHQTSSKLNAWWVDRIVSGYSSRLSNGDLGETIATLERTRVQLIDGLTPSMVQGACRQHFPDLRRHSLVTLRPTWATRLLSTLRLRLRESPTLLSALLRLTTFSPPPRLMVASLVGLGLLISLRLRLARSSR